MLVHLKNDWFAPGGRHFRKGDTGPGIGPRGVEIPDELFAFLPKSAKVIGDPPKMPEPVVPTLRDHDPARAAGDAEDAVKKKATLTLGENADRIRKQLAVEGKAPAK